MNLEKIGTIQGFDVFLSCDNYGDLFGCFGDFTQELADNGIKLTLVWECQAPYFLAEVL